MSGDVTWQQLLFIVGLILASAVGVGTLIWVALWKLWELVGAERDATDKRFSLVQERFNLEREMMDVRLSKIEIFNAGLMSVMKQMEEFRDDVKGRFEDLTRDRRDDMQNIHRRLDRLISAQRDVEDAHD